MDILQALRSRVDQAEVVRLRGESTRVGFEANRLKSSQIEETSGTALRVVKAGRLGFAASSDESTLDKLIENVLESAAYGDELPVAFPGMQPGADVSTYDPAIVELPVSRLVELGQEMVELLLEVEPEARVEIELERGVERLFLQNQAGADIQIRRSPLSVSLGVIRVQGDDVLAVFDRVGTTLWDQDLLDVARRVGKRLALAKSSATIRSGSMPILFAPAGALVLALPLVLGLNGKNVHMRTSPLAGKIGSRLFDAKLTIVDDPTLDGRFSSAPYDDEGVVRRRNALVERGVLRGFYYDLKTAAQAGTQSTGNGARGLFEPPSPSPSNLVFEAGETPLADMIASIQEGLLVQHPLGLGQGNVLSGAFSNSWSLAYKIEKGEIVGRVKDVSIAGNVYDRLRSVAAVSRETEWVYTNFKLPYLLLPEMNVVAKQG